MRFLIAFVAIIGYASASYIGALGYGGWGVNPGDAQAAAIDATVAARDHARAAYEGQARLAEANLWGSVAARQNGIAAAQSQAAAISGAIAGRSGYLAAPYLAGGLGAVGLGAGAWGGLAAPYGLGIRAW